MEEKTTIQYIEEIENIKTDIKSALTEKGQDVSDNFKTYGQIIRELPSGGGGYEKEIIEGSATEIINDEATSVKSYLCYENRKFTYVSMKNVSEIGGSAFMNCFSLSYASFPNVQIVYGDAFLNCKPLTEFIAPKLNNVRYQAFSNISSLSNILMSDKVAIYGYAFYSASRLSFVQIPSMAVLLASTAFHQNVMTYFSSVNFAFSVPNGKTITELSGDWYGINSNAVSSNSYLTSVNLPNAWYIDSNAFSSCTNLTDVSLPNAEYIGSNAFYRAGIISIDLPKCLSTGMYPFSYCNSLEYLSMPLVSIINSSLCSGLSNLSFANINNAISIGDHAFQNCYALESVVMDNVNYISESAFMYCSALKSITINNCEILGQSAFCNCYNLSYAEIKGCKTMYSSPFSNCSSLMDIYLGDRCSFEILGYMLNSSINIHVPASRYDWYVSTYSDKSFMTKGYQFIKYSSRFVSY